MLQVYHDPASTVPPQMADRIDALRAALERIRNYRGDGLGTAIAARAIAGTALDLDDDAARAQDEAQFADHDALPSIGDEDPRREICGFCGEPCILDPHFACAMEQAQR